MRPLDAGQPRNVQSLPPKREPDARNIFSKAVCPQMGIDQRFNPRARPLGEPQPRGGIIVQLLRNGSEGCLKQPILIAKIMHGEARRNIRAGRNCVERKVNKTNFC